MVTLAVLAFFPPEDLLQAARFLLFIFLGLSDKLKSNDRGRGGLGFALVRDLLNLIAPIPRPKETLWETRWENIHLTFYNFYASFRH